MHTTKNCIAALILAFNFYFYHFFQHAELSQTATRETRSCTSGSETQWRPRTRSTGGSTSSTSWGSGTPRTCSRPQRVSETRSRKGRQLRGLSRTIHGVWRNNNINLHLSWQEKLFLLQPFVMGRSARVESSSRTGSLSSTQVNISTMAINVII